MKKLFKESVNDKVCKDVYPIEFSQVIQNFRDQVVEQTTKYNLMKKVVFLLGIAFFNQSFAQEPSDNTNSNPTSISYSNNQIGFQQEAKSDNDVSASIYRYVAWTEPFVIRKDYDLFRIDLHSKVSGITSLAWPLKNSHLEESGFHLERDGLKLQEVTLYDDGSHGDQKAGDGLLSCDRLFLQGEPTYPDIYTYDNIGVLISLIPYGCEIKAEYADGHQGIISQNQLLDYSVLNIMVLKPDINPIPNIRQLSDSVYATDYIAFIIIPVDTSQILDKNGWSEFPEVSKSFYTYFNDDIDFFFFDCKPLWPVKVGFTHNTYSTLGGLVKNDTEGISLPITDYTQKWGSNRLQYIVPNGGASYTTLYLYNHELLHRWINTLSGTLGITEGGHHWGFIQRNTTGFGGLIPYNGVADTIYRENDSTFCRGEIKGGINTWFCNDLELYLMGLKEIDSVRFPIITLPEGTPINNQDYCYKADSIRMISKNEFLSILGNRVPGVNQSQKHFRFSNLLVSKRKPYVSEIAYYDQSMRLYELPKGPNSPRYGKLGLTFEEATGGRATMGTKLSPKFVSEQNYLPVAIKPILRKLISINTAAVVINLDTIFIDPNGDVLTFKAISSNPNILSVNISGNNLLISPENYGSVTCVIEADDGYGGTTEIAFVIEVSNTINRINNPENSDINIYPNPANKILHIDGLKNISSVDIFNSSGQLFISKHIADNQIDITSLSKGIYFVRIIENKRITTKRFVKQ